MASYLEVFGKEIELSERTADKIEKGFDIAEKACLIFAGGCICWAIGHVHGQKYAAEQIKHAAAVAVEGAYYQGWHDALKALIAHTARRG